MKTQNTYKKQKPQKKKYKKTDRKNIRRNEWRILRISRLVSVVLQSEKNYITLYILHMQNTHKKMGYREKRNHTNKKLYCI